MSKYVTLKYSDTLVHVLAEAVVAIQEKCGDYESHPGRMRSFDGARHYIDCTNVVHLAIGNSHISFNVTQEELEELKKVTGISVENP